MIFLALYHKNRKQEITNVFMTKADDDARKNTFLLFFSAHCCFAAAQTATTGVFTDTLPHFTFFFYYFV